MIARAPTSAYALAFPCPSRREPGVPWSKKTGNPSGSPHSAIVSVRPSAAATLCVPDAPAMTASSSTGLHGDKLALVGGIPELNVILGGWRRPIVVADSGGGG